ncbi:hypothetical protein Tco_0847450, partial [Tanacetum coccineum]
AAALAAAAALVAAAALAAAAEDLLVTLVRRYGSPTSGYESYMLAVRSEMPNSTQRNMPKPLGKPEPPDPIVVQFHSKTVYPRPTHRLSETTKSVYPEYPLSQHKHPVCPAPRPQQARSLYH